MPTHNIYAFTILFELWWENDEIKQIEAGHWSIFFKKPDVGDTKNRGKVNLQMASIHALRFLNEFFFSVTKSVWKSNMNKRRLHVRFKIAFLQVLFCSCFLNYVLQLCFKNCVFAVVLNSYVWQLHFMIAFYSSFKKLCFDSFF